MNDKTKNWLVVCWLLFIAAGITGFFWYTEWKYNLPTPVPANYVAVSDGSFINLASYVKTTNHKPLFLHFFNPDCPCSKFNMPHFESLVKQYGGKANFAIIIMSDKKFTQEEIQKKFNLNVPVLFDSAIAKKCGVYSTPQAVIIDKDSKLFYRGNYNRSRYCTNTETNYAQIALDSLLNNKTSIIFNRYAVTAYGCALPKCTQ